MNGAQRIFGIIVAIIAILFALHIGKPHSGNTGCAFVIFIFALIVLIGLWGF